MNWIHRLFRRRRIEREVDAELRFHFERQVHDYIKTGMSEDEARRQATLTFGTMDAVKEECRDARRVPIIDGLIRDAAYAIRVFRRNPGFTLSAIVTLAVGIGSATTICSFVKSVLLDPLPYPNSDRIVALSGKVVEKNIKGMHASPPDFMDWQTSTAFQAMGACAEGTFNLGGDSPVRLNGAQVSSGFFDTMGLNPIIGRTISPEDDQPGADRVAVIGRSLWQQRFGGDPNVVGRSITLSNKPFTIIGVVADDYIYFDHPVLFLPLALGPDEIKESERFSQYLQVFARLKDGVTLEQARADMDRIAHQINRDHPSKNYHDIGVVTLLEETVGPVQERLLMFLGAASLLLLIACTNVANLFLARTTAREREIGIRTALGAGRGRVVRQLLTESTIISLAGGVIGTLLATWGVRTIVLMSPANIPRLHEVTIDLAVLAFTLVLSLTTGVLFGLAPAVSASAADISESLKTASGSGLLDFSRHRLRGAFVCLEVAITVVLLVSAGLLVRSFVRLNGRDPGFRPDGVITMEVLWLSQPQRSGTMFQQILDNIRDIPSVTTAGATTNLPMSRTNMRFGMRIENPPLEAMGKSLSENIRAISSDYFRTLGVQVIEGRDFSDHDTSDSMKVMMINHAMAQKYWADRGPIGQRIAISRGSGTVWREIVGVVTDMRSDGLASDASPEMYVPFSQEPFPFMRFVVRTGDVKTGLLPRLREAVATVDKNLPVTFRSMDDYVSSSIAQPRFNALLIGVFAAAALILAAVGIYSVIAYSVARRTREIGVRIALGADRRLVVRQEVVRGLIPTLAGILIGLAVSLALTRVLTTYLFGIRPTDPSTIGAVITLFIAVAFVAAFVPARRASKVDPMIALRNE